MFGVTTTTLRRWEKTVFFSHIRTFGQHRRYRLTDVLNTINPKKVTMKRKTICYSRVSSHDQKADLVRQSKVCMIFVPKINMKI